MPKEVLNKTYDKAINANLSEGFWIADTGIYLVLVRARANAWWQNIPSFLRHYFSDDELKVSIDMSEKTLFWNGNDLRGLAQLGIIISKLSPGSHTILIEPKNTPKLESVQIFGLTEKEFNIKTILGREIEDGNRRPWLKILFNRVILKQLGIKVSCQSGKFYGITDKDDDDLQVIIDNQVIRNDEPKSHQNWYWCGRTLKGSSKSIELRPENSNEVTSILLLTDRSPNIESFTVTLEKKLIQTIQEVKDKVVSEAKKYGYDPKILLRLAERESNFDPLATSPDGKDKGIFQLRDVTLIEIRRINGREINPFDAEDNIEGGLIYFDDLYKKYRSGQDVLKTTLVAWNIGPTYVNENYPLNFDEIPETTKKLIDFVLKQK
ncbi:MAG: lytic transglycosylase domain-containing protein [Patescibacteria group bacterium]